jgi:hypothetical protein
MGRMDETMQIIAICQEFGWTYNEYMDQPQYFLTLVKEKMVRDNKERELKSKNNRHGR